MIKIVTLLMPLYLRATLLVGVMFYAAWTAGQGPQFSTADPRFAPTTMVSPEKSSRQNVPVISQKPGKPAPIEEPGVLLTAAEHPWGRFVPKTWTCTQTITWNYQDQQQTVMVRDTKTTLESIDDDGVTLQQASSTYVGGRRIESAPTLHRFDFFQEPIQENTVISNGGAGKLAIKNTNMVIPCEKRVYETPGPTEKQKTVIWYSTQLYPYIFRIDSVLTRLPTEAEPEERILRRSTSEVLESSSFHPRWSKLGTYRIRTVKNDGSITTIIDASCSRHVPGGIVHEIIREFDASNKEVRTVETKLINYHCAIPHQETPELGTEEPYYFDEIPRRPRWWRRWYAIPYY